MSQKAELYLWTFDRSPVPDLGGARTFSVGVYQWMPTRVGGVKRSKTIRVLGSPSDAEAVYARAAQLCFELNARSVRADALPDAMPKQITVRSSTQTDSPRSTKGTVRDLVTRAVREQVTPEFKKLGFRGVGRKLYRSLDHVCQLVQIDMGRWGTSERGEIVVNLGVYWHEIEELVNGAGTTRLPPPEYRCTFRVQLQELIGERPEYQNEVTLESNSQRLGARLRADLLTHALPWFEFRSDEQNALSLRPAVVRSPFRSDEWGRRDYLLVLPQLVFLARAGRVEEANALMSELAAYGRVGSKEHSLALRLGLHVPLKSKT